MSPSEFQKKVSRTEKAVMVDFWAPWCVPCRVTKPILEKLAREYEGRIEFIPIKADDSRKVLSRLNIYGIPTVLALQDGKEVARATGAQSEANYRRMFAALAAGEEVKIGMAPFERALRLGAGVSLVMVGVATGSWLAAGVGGLLAFLGIYDRCPIWSAMTVWLTRG